MKQRNRDQMNKNNANKDRVEHGTKVEVLKEKLGSVDERKPILDIVLQLHQLKYILKESNKPIKKKQFSGYDDETRNE